MNLEANLNHLALYWAHRILWQGGQIVAPPSFLPSAGFLFRCHAAGSMYSGVSFFGL